MQRLVDLIESDQLSPLVDRTFPLGQVPQALDYLTTGRVVGKIVIEVVPSR
jgi:NADPH:quinone reductase-like Zn-dependent oxidoreductase